MTYEGEAIQRGSDLVGLEIVYEDENDNPILKVVFGDYPSHGRATVRLALPTTLGAVRSALTRAGYAGL